MRTLIWVLVLLAAAPGAFAQVYKWRDKAGVVHYGESPPPGVRATPVDTEPFGIESDGRKECHTIRCQGQKLDAERRRAEPAPEPPAAARLERSAAPGSARGMDFNVFIRLERGMTEGEVLARAGKPDQEIVEGSEERSVVVGGATSAAIPGGSVRNFGRSRIAQAVVVKTYYYLPTPANPFTTVVTFKGGRVADIERIKKF